MLVCDNDPREKLFYAKRSALVKETANLRGKETEKAGLSTAVKRKVFKVLLLPLSHLPNEKGEGEERPRKKAHRFADRDLILFSGSDSSVETKENRSRSLWGFKK
jgi:hypothetical protein